MNLFLFMTRHLMTLADHSVMASAFIIFCKGGKWPIVPVYFSPASFFSVKGLVDGEQ